MPRTHKDRYLEDMALLLGDRLSNPKPITPEAMARAAEALLDEGEAEVAKFRKRMGLQPSTGYEVADMGTVDDPKFQD